jgi:hypothetical protein
MARRLLVDEVLKRAFVDAYLRYEIGFAQFTTSVTTQAGEADQQARYWEFTEAQHAFLQSARELARSLSEQQMAPPLETTHVLGPDEREGWVEPPDEPIHAPEPEPASEPDGAQEQAGRGRPSRRRSFLFRGSI